MFFINMIHKEKILVQIQLLLQELIYEYFMAIFEHKLLQRLRLQKY